MRRAATRAFGEMPWDRQPALLLPQSPTHSRRPPKKLQGEITVEVSSCTGGVRKITHFASIAASALSIEGACE